MWKKKYEYFEMSIICTVESMHVDVLLFFWFQTNVKQNQWNLAQH